MNEKVEQAVQQVAFSHQSVGTKQFSTLVGISTLAWYNKYSMEHSGQNDPASVSLRSSVVGLVTSFSSVDPLSFTILCF